MISPYLSGASKSLVRTVLGGWCGFHRNHNFRGITCDEYGFRAREANQSVRRSEIVAHSMSMPTFASEIASS